MPRRDSAPRSETFTNQLSYGLQSSQSYCHALRDDALKSSDERWVEIVNFPEYRTFSVEFLGERVEPDGESEREEAGE
jgi:hypothetical protein